MYVCIYMYMYMYMYMYVNPLYVLFQDSVFRVRFLTVPSCQMSAARVQR